MLLRSRATRAAYKIKLITAMMPIIMIRLVDAMREECCLDLSRLQVKQLAAPNPFQGLADDAAPQRSGGASWTSYPGSPRVRTHDPATLNAAPATRRRTRPTQAAAITAALGAASRARPMTSGLRRHNVSHARSPIERACHSAQQSALMLRTWRSYSGSTSVRPARRDCWSPWKGR